MRDLLLERLAKRLHRWHHRAKEPSQLRAHHDALLAQPLDFGRVGQRLDRDGFGAEPLGELRSGCFRDCLGHGDVRVLDGLDVLGAGFGQRHHADHQVGPCCCGLAPDPRTPVPDVPGVDHLAVAVHLGVDKVIAVDELRIVGDEDTLDEELPAASFVEQHGAVAGCDGRFAVIELQEPEAALDLDPVFLHNAGNLDADAVLVGEPELDVEY